MISYWFLLYGDLVKTLLNSHVIIGFPATPEYTDSNLYGKMVSISTRVSIGETDLKLSSLMNSVLLVCAQLIRYIKISDYIVYPDLNS